MRANTVNYYSLSRMSVNAIHTLFYSLFDVFCKLTELRLLDISTEYVAQLNVLSCLNEQNNVNTAISMVMVGGGHPLKNLTSLDISGR